jgi:hypothetical protein
MGSFVRRVMMALGVFARQFHSSSPADIVTDIYDLHRLLEVKLS